MNRSRLSGLGILIAVASFISAPTCATADLVPAATLTSPGILYDGDLYTLGFEFTVNSVLSVTHLGVYDHDADGLLARAEVGIWDSLGTLLASVFVPSGTSGLLVGTFRYEEISPLELTPGNTYIVGSYIDDLASSFNTGQGGSGFYDSAINPIQDRFSNFNSMFSFPDSSNFHPAGAWTGGNFLYEGRAVPEPASLASAISALVIGFAGCLVRRRRSRQARAS